MNRTFVIEREKAGRQTLTPFQNYRELKKKKPMIKNSTDGKYNQEVEPIAHGYNSPNNWLVFSYMERPRIDGTDVGGEYKTQRRNVIHRLTLLFNRENIWKVVGVGILWLYINGESWRAEKGWSAALGDTK